MGWATKITQKMPVKVDGNSSSVRDQNEGSGGAISYNDMSRILSDVVGKTEPPLKVGIYGNYGSGKSRLLGSIQKNLERTSNKDSLRIGLFTLLYRLLFFNPILNGRKSKEVKFIFVNFSILDFAGSDVLWAGIITNIAVAIDKAFGSFAVKMFRMWHYDSDIHLKPYLKPIKRTNSFERWVLAPYHVFILPVVTILVLIGLLFFWGYCTVHVCFGSTPSNKDSTIGVGIASSFLTVSIFGLSLQGTFYKIYNLVYSQAQQIASKASRTNFSSSLGFLGTVKKEIFYISSTVRYMSILLNKDIRVCVIIDEIDLLRKGKLMDLMQVVKLLHASRNSPYIQILCMDPLITANLLQKALQSESAYQASGILTLKRHIQLPFYIPVFDDYIKMQSLMPRNNNESRKVTGNSVQLSKIDVHANDLIMRRSFDDLHLQDDYHESLEFVKSIFRENQQLRSLIEGTEQTMDRILLSTQLAIKMMRLKQSDDPEIKEKSKRLAAWSTFVDQWPYRMCWMVELIEDNEQLARLNPNLVRKIGDDTLLSDLFDVVAEKLATVKDWETLIDLDSDGEVCILFLKIFQFNVGEMKRNLSFTTNMPTSILRIISQSLSRTSVKDRKSMIQKLSWKHKKAVWEWTADDINEELDEFFFADIVTYQKHVVEENIIGEMLIECPLNELQLKFKMKPKDWKIFEEKLMALREYNSV